jgi:hypothetical protein
MAGTFVTDTTLVGVVAAAQRSGVVERRAIAAGRDDTGVGRGGPAVRTIDVPRQSSVPQVDAPVERPRRHTRHLIRKT